MYAQTSHQTWHTHSMEYGEHGTVGGYSEDYSHCEHNEEYHGYHDVSENDSGVNSEDTELEQNNDDIDNNHNAAYYNLTQVTTTNQNKKPLSVWKAKQLKLSAAGVIKRRRDANGR